MPMDAFYDDLDSLRELVSQLSSERDAAVAECKRVMKQNDGFAICCSSSGVPSSAASPNVLTLSSCNWQLRISRQRRRRRLPNKQDGANRKSSEEEAEDQRGSLPAHLRVHITLAPTAPHAPNRVVYLSGIRVRSQQKN